MRLPWRAAPDGDPQPQLLALGDDHARAQGLAAQQPTEPIGPIDAAWLTDHLTGCAGCRSLAEAYEADRALLRGLRDRNPRPPRDLWARTSVALEREGERTVRIRRASLPPRTPARDRRPDPVPSPAPSQHRQPSWTPGIMGGLLVVAILTATSLMTGLARVLPSPSAPGPSGPGATPIAVLADVGWIQSGTDGSYDIYLTRIDRVCPLADPSACAPIHDVARASISLGSRPQSVSLSPSTSHLVVVGSGASAGAVLVVPVPTAPIGAAPSATPAVAASTRPGGSVVTLPSASPAIRTALPSALASPRASGAGPQPSQEVAGTVTIAEGVIVVGGSGAYSPDGTWFAFAARPSDGSAGPDIYVWRAGEARARAVTTDHRSIFSAWLGDRILGSRVDAAPTAVPAVTPAPTASSGTAAPAASPRGSGAGSSQGVSSSPGASLTPAPAITGATTRAAELGARTFVLDPATGEIQELPSVAWFRPVVDATGRWVVFWEGSVVADQAGTDWRPATGRLVVAPWSLGPARAPGPAASAVPGASPSAAPNPTALPGRVTPGAPSASAAGKASPEPVGSGVPGASGEPARPGGPQEIVAGPLADFDAQFDPGGTHLAVWTASQADPNTGFLSLYVLREGAWRLDPARKLVAVPTLRGFSIGAGELAWVTPPGPDGHGSQIEVMGWTADGFGSVESAPGDGVVVIR